MSDILIFGGTTEGRELAQFCADSGISADICVATDYGAKVLPKSEFLKIRIGRLDCDDMKDLMMNGYKMVIDATHPFAEEVTKNIRSACDSTGNVYYRLLREETKVTYGLKVRSMGELVEVLNRSDGIILSTLGSKEAGKLTEVRDFRARIWIRALPDDKVREMCVSLGYDKNKLILEKGPFSAEQNLRHIKLSGADIVVTKESGSAGGYTEKAEAAKLCGAALVTVVRPEETGLSMAGIQQLLLQSKEVRM
ncbi:MAG: precorrin-6A reductase [Ruminococcus sp.]|nr:precorrin-6A reductase [Ruminococcus sp.]